MPHKVWVIGRRDGGRNGSKCAGLAEVEGKGLEGKGRGSDKGPITVTVGPIRRSGSHPRRLVSTSYAL